MSYDPRALAERLLAEALGAERPVEPAAQQRTRDLFAGQTVAARPQIRTVRRADGTLATGIVVAKPRVACPNGCGRTFAEQSGGVAAHSLPSVVGDPRSKPSHVPCTAESAAIYRNAAK